MREFDSGNLRSHIMHLSWPMVIANILQNVAAGYALFLIGRISVEALAAYSIAVSSLIALFASVHGALINAAMALVSRKCGAKQQHLISEALPGMLAFGTLVFVVYAGLMYSIMGPALSFFGAKAEVLSMAKDYTGIVLISCFFMTFYSLLLGVARGSGDSVTPLKVVLVLVSINIVLYTVFIGKMRMGLKGAALAEMCGYAGGAISYFIVYLRGLNGIKLSGFRWNRAVVKTYAELTGKSIVQNFTGDFGSMIMLRIIAGYGNAFIAAYGIGSRLVNFLLMVGWPITNSGGVIVGQNLGKSRRDLAMETVLQSFIVFCWAAVPTGLLFLIFPAQVMAAFTSDNAALQYGVIFLMIMGPSMPFLAAGQAAQSAFNGAGSIGVPILLNVATIILRIGLAVTLPFFAYLRENGIFWSISISYVFFGLIYWYFYNRKKWMLKEI